MNLERNLTWRAVMKRTPLTARALIAAILTLAAVEASAGSRSTTTTVNGGRHGSSYGFTPGKDGRETFSYAIVKPSHEGQSLNVDGTGSGSDWKALNRLIQRDTREVLWVKLEGRSYVTRDGDAIAKARAILAPLTRIGDKQSELGDRQSEIGEKQSKIGDRQAEIGDEQAALSDRLAEINERLQDERGASRRSLVQKRLEIQERIAELGRQMQALGRQQATLGASQTALGREQSALGRQQALASEKAQIAMRHHAEDLIAQGLFEDLD